MSSLPSSKAALGGLLAAICLAPSACSAPARPEPSPPPEASRPESFAVAAPPVHERPAARLPPLREPGRGLGLMTARPPGTQETVGGVRLVSHHARVTVEAGVAHTEVEEVFRNDTPRVLEGKLVLPLPEGAALARLALWVGSSLVEGEVVEKRRADRIFRGIVDDTVRPRDPALLDVVDGGRLSLRIFPLPAHGDRKVLFAYDQVLKSVGGTLRYVHPLSLGQDRATPIDDLSVTVDGVVVYEARHAVPTSDVVVDLAEAAPSLAVATLPAAAGRAAEAAIVLRQVADDDAAGPPFSGDVALALDVSDRQSEASLSAQIHAAFAVLEGLSPGESFSLLACDDGCEGFPAEGRAMATEEALSGAARFLSSLAPGGPSDPAGALAAAAKRLDPQRPGQVVLFSDGTATAGELSVASQLDHVSLVAQAVDVRLVGAGRTVDDRALSQLARGLGATYDKLTDGSPVAERARALAEARRAPVVHPAPPLLPAGTTDAEPPLPMPTRAGEEMVVLARAGGEVAGAARTQAPLPRLWAREKIGELEAGGPEADRAIAALSTRHHLLSRATSLLVLENDAMFAEFGIARTRLPEVGEGESGESAGGGEAYSFGRLSGEHRTKPPQVRMGATSVSGRLPPETIQRIVRQNFGRFRLCYQQGLARNPSLAGRVTTRFVIDRAGEVAAVGDGGSDLPDAGVIACVNQAFVGLSFPQPEGGIVTVVYPITFSVADSDASTPSVRPLPLRTSNLSHWSSWDPRPGWWNGPPEPPPEPPLPPPAVVHREGDDGWMASKPDRLAAMAAQVAKDPGKRSAHLTLVRASLASGSMEDAYNAASTLARLDPELPAAREALAEAAAATGRSDEAVRATAMASSLDPRSKARHLASARAWAARGDAARACAHLRALGDLDPREHARRAEVCRAEGRAELPSSSRAGFQARAVCQAGPCPAVAIITPGGRVLSPWTLGSEGPEGAGGALQAGTYRTLVIGGERGGEIVVQALGTSFTARLPEGGGRVTAVVSTVSIPVPRPRLRWRVRV